MEGQDDLDDEEDVDIEGDDELDDDDGDDDDNDDDDEDEDDGGEDEEEDAEGIKVYLNLYSCRAIYWCRQGLIDFSQCQCPINVFL